MYDIGEQMGEQYFKGVLAGYLGTALRVAL